MSENLVPVRDTEAPRSPVVAYRAAFLGFELAGAEYAFPLPSVVEIHRMVPLTSVPRCPDVVRGVISLRGVITTVFDMSPRLTDQLCEEPSRIVVVRLRDESVGLLVNKVTRVLRLSSDEIEELDEWGPASSAHIIGVARPAEDVSQTVTLIDPQALWEDVS